MKMKDLQIVIDLKDLFLEVSEDEYGYATSGDEDFNSVIKEEIERKVIDTIIKGFTPDIIDKLKAEVIDKFQESYQEKISERIIKSIDRGVFTTKDGKTYSVDSLVHEKFKYAVDNNQSFMRRIDTKIKSDIETMEKTLQKRYDLQFASGIIKNMKDSNLLKEGAEKLILGE